MGAFASGRGLKLLTDFVLEVARDFLATWTNKNLSALKKLELLRAFFRFTQDSGWVSDNPARKIKNPKVAERQTLPFEQDETIRMIECCSGPKKARLRALVLLLRYSGLRIRDASPWREVESKTGICFFTPPKPERLSIARCLNLWCLHLT